MAVKDIFSWMQKKWGREKEREEREREKERIPLHSAQYETKSKEFC